MEINLQRKHIINTILIFFTIISLVTLLLIYMYSKTITDKPEDIQDQSIEMGAVSLDVINLDLEKDFYMNGLGLEQISENGNTVELGFNNKKLVILNQKDNIDFAPAQEAGLYHLALVFSTQESLANTLQNTFIEHSELYQGSADHLATEAFYFSDPEGNGVEIYFDKPKSEWSYDANGRPVMGSIYLDEAKYISDYASNSKDNFDINMGHVHLKIGNVTDAKKFYVDTLLFEVINSRLDSLFVSRDNYHHHLGMNTWQSIGAEMRKENLTGLDYFEINYLDQELFNQIKENIKSSDYSYEEISDNKWEVLDPWGTRVVIKI